MLTQLTDDGLKLGNGLQEFVNKLNFDVENYAEIIKKFSELDFEFDNTFKDKDGKIDWKVVKENIKDCDDVAISYFKTLDDGKGTINNTSASVEGMAKYLKTTGSMFDWAALKAGIFNTVLNAGIGFLVSAGLQLVVKAIDDYVHRVDNAKDALDDLNTEIESRNNTYKSHSELIDKVSKSYDTLASKVDTSTNRNLELSEEEYSEFLSITNEIADAFPTLVKGFDESGNAVLDFGDDCENSTEKLKELLETEKQLNNVKIASELPEYFKNTETVIKDYDNQIKEYQRQVNELSNTVTMLNNIETGELDLFAQSKFSADDLGAKQYSELHNLLNKSLSEFVNELSSVEKLNLGNLNLGVSDFITSDGQNMYLDLVNLSSEQKSQLEAIIKENINTLSLTVNDELANAKMSLNQAESSKESSWKDFTQNLVAGMNSKASFQALSAEGQQLATALVQGLNSGVAKEMSDQDPYKYVQDNIIAPLSALGEEESKTVADAYTKLLTLNSDDLSQVNQTTIDNLLKTLSEILGKDENELKISLGFEINEDLKAKYDNAVQQATSKLGINQSDVEGIFTELGIDTTAEIDKWNKVTVGIKDATEAKKAYLSEGLPEGNKTADLLGISETIIELDTKLKPAMDALGEAYQDIFTSDGFTRENIGLDMFSSIKDELNELSDAGISIDYSSFEELYNVLNDTESSADDIKDAFDKLAYSIASASLSGIEDFETLKNALHELGYINYEIVAFESLVNNTDALVEAGLNLESATKKEIVAFASEMVSAENLAQAVNILTFAKEMCSLQDMDTSGEVAHLKTLAENAGYTGTIIEYLTELEKIYQEVSSGTLSPSSLEHKLNRAEELKGLIEAEASKINFAPKAESQDWKPFEKASTKAAGKAGKDAAEEYKEALEKELSDLDTVLGFITDTIDDQIDLYEEQKDAAVDALEAQKEAAEEAHQAQIDLVEAQIDSIEKQVEAKEKEIKAIQDARKERELAFSLQKAEYEWNRMINQKVSLAYVTGQDGLFGQMVYRHDISGARDKKEELDKAKEDIEINKIEKEVDILEEEIKGLEDVIDGLNKQIEESNKYYDDLIKQTQKYYDNLIKGMEEYKSRWEEISELEEQAKIKSVLEELGMTTDDVLNMSGDAFEQFKQRYVNVLAEMNKGDESFLDGLSQASGIAREQFGNIITTAQDELSKMNQLGNDAGQGFVDGWKEKSEEIKGATKQTAEEAVKSFAEGQNSNSPSEDYKSLAYDAVDGLLLGVEEKKQSFIDSIKSLAEEGILAFGEAFNFEDSTLVTSFDSLKLLIESVCEAVGLGTEDSVGGLIGALTTLSEFSLGGLGEGESTGIIGQFNALKTAVDDVTSSISGGGSEESETGGIGASGGATQKEEGSDGLVGAIETLQQTTDEALGVASTENEEGSGIIGKFSALKTAVDEVTKTIGTGEEGSEESETLIGALQKHYEKAEETLPQVKGFFEELLTSIEACVVKLGELSSGIASLDNDGTPVEFDAKGTSYAKRGLHVVGEEAPELIEDTKGNLSLATKPTLLNMKGGEKVYNGDETAELLRPLDSSHPQYEMFMKAQKYFGNTPELSYPTANVWSKKIDGMINGIKNVNTVNNTTPSYVLNGGINVTCPNVTDAEVAKRISGELEKAFFGMSNYANQRASITR